MPSSVHAGSDGLDSTSEAAMGSQAQSPFYTLVESIPADSIEYMNKLTGWATGERARGEKSGTKSTRKEQRKNTYSLLKESIPEFVPNV